jgi:transcription elongation factor Elf1
VNVHYGVRYDYHFNCSRCGLEVETTIRVTKDLDAFAEFVNRIHRCQALPLSERGDVEHDNPTAGERAEGD